MQIVEQFVFDKTVCIVQGVLFPLGKKKSMSIQYCIFLEYFNIFLCYVIGIWGLFGSITDHMRMPHTCDKCDMPPGPQLCPPPPLTSHNGSLTVRLSQCSCTNVSGLLIICSYYPVWHSFVVFQTTIHHLQYRES